MCRQRIGKGQGLTRWARTPHPNRMSWLRGSGQRLLLRLLGLADARAAAQAAHEACVLAQRAAAHALTYAQDARASAELSTGRVEGPATGGRAGLDEDINDLPYPR